MAVLGILPSLPENDVDAHTDDGVTLHSWMAKHVDSAHGLAGIEGTHTHDTDERCRLEVV
jgi:hypothetical protein